MCKITTYFSWKLKTNKITHNFQIYESFKNLNISLIFFDLNSAQIPLKSHSSFRFVRGLFVIYGTFPRLIRRKHEQTTNKRRARLLKDCFLSATYLVKFLSRKKKMHPTKNPNLRWGFLRNYIRKTMLLLFQQHVFSRGLVVHWQEPIGSH